MLGLDLLLIPRYGIVGAAAGWSAAMLTDAALGLTQVRRGLGLRSFDASTAHAAAVVVLGFGAPALALRFAQQRFADDAPAGLVLFAGCTVAGLTYAAALLARRRPLGLADLAGALRARTRPRPTDAGTGSAPTLPLPRSPQ
jgi:hypothetical protein